MIDPSQLESVRPGAYVARVTRQRYFDNDEEENVSIDCELLRLDVVLDLWSGPEIVAIDTLWEPHKQLREIALDTLHRALLAEIAKRGWPPCTTKLRLWLPTQCYVIVRPQDFT